MSIAILNPFESCHLFNSDGSVGQHLVSSVMLQSRSFYSEGTVVFTQVGYVHVQQPLWTVECTGGRFSCPSVSCPLWYHVSGVGRLLERTLG